MADSLAIAQVTPFAWEAGHEVNHFVASVSGELAERGHRVLIVAPSQSPALVRDTRRAIRDSGEELLGTLMILDRAPKGRNETTTMDFVRRHDEYETASKPRGR